jgi:5-methyltetrahydrofolate--homocysteine methyltransferase
MKSFLEILKEKIVVFDGATGTHVQGQNLNADDFGGEHLQGCNEYLVLSKPSAVVNIHKDYLDAGADVIETNSFGSTSIVLAEYSLADKAYELNYEAARIARGVAADYSTPSYPRFVAGSIGPTTKLPSLGHIAFLEMARAYKEQAHGLVEGGVDLLCLETCQDTLQMKAALYGIFEYFEEARRRLPVIASVTVETMGTMLLGTEISAALTTLEPFDLDVIGSCTSPLLKQPQASFRYAKRRNTRERWRTCPLFPHTGRTGGVPHSLCQRPWGKYCRGVLWDDERTYSATCPCCGGAFPRREGPGIHCRCVEPISGFPLSR